MRKKDHYQVLGVARSATAEEIKKAYRKIALQYHPDKSPGNKWAEEKFKEATAAYQTLTNPTQRQLYDQTLSSNGTPVWGTQNSTNRSSRFSNIFDELFKRQPEKKQPRQHTATNAKGKRGADIKVEVAISFAESVQGGERVIEVQRAEACDTCGGTGTRKGSLLSTCPRCMGHGEIQQRTFLDNGQGATQCYRCAGTGVIVHQPCRSCLGTGTVRASRALRIKIPPGIESGKSLRLTAQGECGVRGGGIGDLFVKVTVEPHPTLRKEGDDLRCEIPISFAKAALGGEIRVPTLTGTAVLHIPKGTQGNQLFRLAGQGIQKADGRCGDLFVTVIIEVPTSLTWKQEQLLKEYAELEERAAAFRRRDTQR